MPLPKLPDGTRMQIAQQRIEHVGSFASGLIDGPFEVRYETNTGVATTGGSVSIATDPASITVMSPGSANYRAVLRYLNDINVANMKAIWMRLEGLRFSIEGGYDISMRLGVASTAGITLRHNANDGTAQPAVIRFDQTPTISDVTTTFRFYGPDADFSPALLPSTVELLWHPQRKRAYVFSGELLLEVDTTPAIIGVIRPQMIVATKNTVSRGFTVERIVVGYEHN